MRKLKRLFIIILLVVFSGCSDYFLICALNPFYEKDDVVVPEGMEGLWIATPDKQHLNIAKESVPWKTADTLSVWHIERVKNEKKLTDRSGQDSVVYVPADFYDVHLSLYSTDTLEYRFRMVVFRLKEHYYADFSPLGNTSLDISRFGFENYLNVHTLARITLENGNIGFSWLGSDYMKEMIENKRVRASYRWLEKPSRLILTGSSRQLTEMIKRYGDQTRFVEWDKQSARLLLTPAHLTTQNSAGSNEKAESL